MASFILIDVLLLMLIIWLAGRTLRAAADRAKASRRTTITQQEAARNMSGPAIETDSPTSQSWQELPFQAKSLAVAASDLYADPIDGVPFASGEEIFVCNCGVGYRLDCLDWLSQNCSGKCVQCGLEVDGHRRLVA